MSAAERASGFAMSATSGSSIFRMATPLSGRLSIRLPFLASDRLAAAIVRVVVVADCRHRTDVRLERPERLASRRRESWRGPRAGNTPSMRRRVSTVSAASVVLRSIPLRHCPADEKISSERAMVVLLPQLPVTAMKVVSVSLSRLSLAIRFNTLLPSFGALLRNSRISGRNGRRNMLRTNPSKRGMTSRAAPSVASPVLSKCLRRPTAAIGVHGSPPTGERAWRSQVLRPRAWRSEG